MSSEITIREATIEDVRFVAWTVLAALDMDTEHIEKTVLACSRDDSLYSWRHAILALSDHTPVGCLIAYEGARYPILRNSTWECIWGRLDEEYLQSVEMETRDGEFYLDSMAVLPQYRGRFIGKKLLEYAIERGRQKGYEASTLIVSQEKPHLKSYYQGIGFMPFGEMEFFGHWYTRMKRLVPTGMSETDKP